MRNINLRYVDEAYDENGLLTKFDITMPDNFNFAYDVVDDIAINDPERTAMVWCNPEGEEHTFTFADMKTWSDKTANFMADCGIGRGDFVMVILRRHYQFWFTMLALEKLGAVAVPATFMLKEHDLTYRLNGADIKAIIATSAGDIAGTIDAVVKECPSVETLILVNPAGAGLTPRDEDGNWVAPAGELVGEALSGPAGITSTARCARLRPTSPAARRPAPIPCSCTSPRAPRAIPRWCSTIPATRWRTSSRPSTGTT